MIRREHFVTLHYVDNAHTSSMIYYDLQDAMQAIEHAWSMQTQGYMTFARVSIFIGPAIDDLGLIDRLLGGQGTSV